jgi:hypothetical protein
MISFATGMNTFFKYISGSMMAKVLYSVPYGTHHNQQLPMINGEDLAG